VGAGKPVPAGGGFGRDYSIPDGFGGGGGDGYSEAGAGMLKLVRPVAMSNQNIENMVIY